MGQMHILENHEFMTYRLSSVIIFVHTPIMNLS